MSIRIPEKGVQKISVSVSKCASGNQADKKLLMALFVCGTLKVD